MPNEVFLRTRAGLAAMVSTRAASRILVSVLEGRGQNPDDVDAVQMRSALLGPVLNELEGVLPPAGLRRNLERLADLVQPPVQTVEVEATTSSSISSGRTFVPAPSTSTPSPAEPAEPLPPPSTSHSVQTDEPTADRTGQQAQREPAAPEASVRTRPRSERALIRQVTAFAQIEHVTLVAAFRQDGSVIVSRGAGPDLSRLGRLSRLALSLLAKVGTLHSIHLGHTSGELFLFPVGTDILVLFGGADLNLGAVNTAFSAFALEEEV